MTQIQVKLKHGRFFQDVSSSGLETAFRAASIAAFGPGGVVVASSGEAPSKVHPSPSPASQKIRFVRFQWATSFTGLLQQSSTWHSNRVVVKKGVRDLFQAV